MRTTARRILLVEDEPTTREVLTAILRGEGYEVDSVASTGAATTCLQSIPYELVIARTQRLRRCEPRARTAHHHRPDELTSPQFCRKRLRTCSTSNQPAGRARSRSASFLVCSTSGQQRERFAVQRQRQRPAKQNQSSPLLVDFHFVFGDLAPVNSKMCDAVTRHLPGPRLV
jgi:CheY-like chemotaxis protein